MGAITWQNINGPSLAEAARPMESAQKSFDAMFGSFDNILKQRQATETANWDQGKLNNTNALLGAVQGAKTPEEYAALEAGLREQMAGYGAQVDATAARSAMDTRLGTLQQRAKQAGEFQDWTTDQAEAPITREIAAANARQDPLTANLLMEANPGLRSMPALAAAYTASQRQITDDAQKATTFANNQSDQRMQEALHTGALELQTAQIASSKAETEAKQAATNTKGVANQATAMVNDHRKQQANLVEGAKVLAKEMNFPVDPITGAVTPSKETGQTPELVAKFQAELTKRYGVATTPSQTLEGVAKYLASTGMSVKDQNDFMKSAGDSLTDVNLLAPSDKAKTEANTTKLEKERESVVKNNPWYGADKDKSEGITRVLKQTDGIKDALWTNIPETLNDFMTKGYEHNGVKVLIPPKVLEQALAAAGGIQKDTSVWNSTLGRTKDELDKILSDPKTVGLIEQASTFDNTETQKKGAFIDSLKLPATARGNQTNFDNFLKSELEKAKLPK